MLRPHDQTLKQHYWHLGCCKPAHSRFCKLCCQQRILDRWECRSILESSRRKSRLAWQSSKWIDQNPYGRSHASIRKADEGMERDLRLRQPPSGTRPDQTHDQLAIINKRESRPLCWAQRVSDLVGWLFAQSKKRAKSSSDAQACQRNLWLLVLRSIRLKVLPVSLRWLPLQHPLAWTASWRYARWRRYHLIPEWKGRFSGLQWEMP